MASPTMHWAVTVPTRSEQRVSLRGPSASEPQQRKGRGDCADWRGDCGPSRDAARPGEAGPRSVGPRSADAFCSHCSTARRLHLSLYPSPGSTHENSSSPVGRRCRATALPSARGCQRQTDSRTDGPIWTQRRTRQRESTMRATYTGRAICVRKVMQNSDVRTAGTHLNQGQPVIACPAIQGAVERRGRLRRRWLCPLWSTPPLPSRKRCRAVRLAEQQRLLWRREGHCQPQQQDEPDQMHQCGVGRLAILQGLDHDSPFARRAGADHS